MFSFFKNRRRREIQQQPFPAEWERVLVERYGLYRRLPEPVRRSLGQHIQVFLDEKIFEGCNGVEMTDEVRVLIAAQACLLLLGLDHDYYPNLRTVLVYPEAFVSDVRDHDGWIVHEGRQVRLGEAWSHGAVVLSWEDVVEGADDPDDGYNVVLHEFAHKLDQETGVSNGTPFLDDAERYESWARVFTAALHRLEMESMLGGDTVLDVYGTTNPAEFFAVATEAFFERSEALRDRHPELYAQLASFYRQDPVTYR